MSSYTITFTAYHRSIDIILDINLMLGNIIFVKLLIVLGKYISICYLKFSKP